MTKANPHNLKKEQSLTLKVFGVNGNFTIVEASISKVGTTYAYIQCNDSTLNGTKICKKTLIHECDFRTLYRAYKTREEILNEEEYNKLISMLRGYFSSTLTKGCKLTLEQLRSICSVILYENTIDQTMINWISVDSGKPNENEHVLLRYSKNGLIFITEGYFVMHPRYGKEWYDYSMRLLERVNGTSRKKNKVLEWAYKPK